jgi:long-chain fatty acid transport protein
VGWDDWSALDNLLISTEQGSSEIARNWKDTYHISVVVHYRPDDDWLLQAGIAFDTSPVDEDDRTPDMPIDRQIRYAVGAQYQWTDDINVGASFVFIDMGDAEIDRPFLKGEYSENFLLVFGLNLGWKF